MYCTQCGKEVSELDRNCPRCDAPLESAETKAPKKNPGGETTATPKPERKGGITISFPTALLLGIVIIGAVLLFTHRSSPTEQTASQVADTTQWSPQVISVAKNFLCTCGECDYNLVTCTCKKPNGSVEMKTFIKNGLQEGKAPAQMIAAVAKKFNTTPIPQ